MFLPKHKLPPAPWDDVEPEASWENSTSGGTLGGGMKSVVGKRTHSSSDLPVKGKALLRRGGGGGLQSRTTKRLRLVQPQGGVDRDNGSSQVYP